MNHWLKPVRYRRLAVWTIGVLSFTGLLGLAQTSSLATLLNPTFEQMRDACWQGYDDPAKAYRELERYIRVLQDKDGKYAPVILLSPLALIVESCKQYKDTYKPRPSQSLLSAYFQQIRVPASVFRDLGKKDHDLNKDRWLFSLEVEDANGKVTEVSKANPDPTQTTIDPISSTPPGISPSDWVALGNSFVKNSSALEASLKLFYSLKSTSKSSTNPVVKAVLDGVDQPTWPISGRLDPPLQFFRLDSNSVRQLANSKQLRVVAKKSTIGSETIIQLVVK